MPKREPTPEQFLGNVAAHQMTLSHECEIYRHVQFKAPKTSNMWFDLVTWPGFLTIAGDMGTWTFSRTRDMFKFFRSSELAINASYWAEKIQNGVNGGRDNAREFDQEAFGERLIDQIENHYCLEGKDLASVTAAVKEEILGQEEGNGPYALMHAAADFVCTLPSGEEFRFDPCGLPDGKVYSYHFIWCLYAIVWGIQQYDSQRPASATDKAGEC